MKTCPIHPGVAAVGFALVMAMAAMQAARAAASLQLIQPAELARLLGETTGQKPLIIQVGFRTLYDQAHIPGSEYVGSTSNPQGLKELHKWVQGLPRNRFIVLYCGCCPWNHCPNVQPAYKALQAMGFRNVRVLYIASNFGADWVDKGYPVSQGK